MNFHMWKVWTAHKHLHLVLRNDKFLMLEIVSDLLISVLRNIPACSWLKGHAGFFSLQFYFPRYITDPNLVFVRNPWLILQNYEGPQGQHLPWRNWAWWSVRRSNPVLGTPLRDQYFFIPLICAVFIPLQSSLSFSSQSELNAASWEREGEASPKTHIANTLTHVKINSTEMPTQMGRTWERMLTQM